MMTTSIKATWQGIGTWGMVHGLSYACLITSHWYTWSLILAGACGRQPDARQQPASLLLSLENYLPVGTKKTAKVYTVTQHPLQPDVVAVGANAGATSSDAHQITHYILPVQQFTTSCQYMLLPCAC